MTRNLRDVIHSFKCGVDEGSKEVVAAKVSKLSPKKTSNRGRLSGSTTSAPSDQVLKDLPPSIGENLTAVFVGFNPGVESSKQQHHYAHPTNLFWKLFNASDFLSAVLDLRNTDVSAHERLINEIYLDRKCSARPEHDFQLISLGVGFTDLVLRCTKQASELSELEKTQNIPRLLREFNASQAPFVVFIGKGIWETVCKYLVPKHKLTSQNFAWGMQKDPTVMSRFYTFCEYQPRVYVFPNTSGLVASMKFPEKLALWERLVMDIRSSIEDQDKVSEVVSGAEGEAEIG